MPLKKFQKSSVPLKYAYRLIAPSPLLLVTSFYKGRPNVQTVAWSVPFQHNPPQIILIISKENFSHLCITKTKEFVINIVPPSLLKKAIGCGSVSGRKVDKFKKFKITTMPASKVKPPLIKDCIAHLECKLIMPELAKDDIIVGKVVAAWTSRDAFKERWLIENPKGRFLTHLGGPYFATLASKLVK